MSITPTTTRPAAPSTAASATRSAGSSADPSPRSAAPSSAHLSAPESDPAAVIADARARIDALDDHILGLVQERMAVSAVVQQTRIATGGRRVNLSREMEILSRYRDALGRPGTTLAMTVLELCRGRV
ncbi:chorismate mutase [Streptomyces sp. MJP52]|uniref:chorismate mutase n=1 Tax=Streptomyces sp. MJP52 TaxID=2940555 RepID=UPI0024744736|nr:chorismate mutase [Streptomyces sp. MJP52]MDH6225465.1 chorismate mutase [Streptomyces sp. MJP52]